MKKIVLSLIAISSLGFAGGDMKDVEPAVTPVVVIAEEEKNFYVGLGLSALSTGTGSLDFFDNHERRDRTGNLLFMAGYEFNQYAAVEGRYSIYAIDSDNVETDTWGIYFKPQYPVNEDFKVYALLGFGGASVEGVRTFTSFDEDDTSFQWGLGASYVVAEDIAIFVDYAKLMEDMDTGIDTWTDIDVDALTLGVTYNF